MKNITFQNGFTFLELAGILLVSSVVAGMGLPFAMEMKDSAAGSTLQDDLVLSLNEARAHAVSSGERVSVCSSVDGKSCKSGSWSKGWMTYQGKKLNDGEMAAIENRIGFRKIKNENVELAIFDGHLNEVDSIGFDEQGFNLEQVKISGEVCSSGDTLLSESVHIERSGRVRVLARAESESKLKAFCS